uniref:SH3 domain-containing protein n=1 Tax=Macrostomum lignano TaxID=282301 RepID=A0A1I8F3Q4_9PLAT
MEAVALHDFTPSNSDELRFSKNQLLKVLSMDVDPGWYLAELNGQSGLVPSNYVRMAERTRAGRPGTLIQPDGAFLVRTSETTAPDFSISVKFGNQLQHFKVLKDEAGKYYLCVYKPHAALRDIGGPIAVPSGLPNRAAPAATQTTALPSQQRVGGGPVRLQSAGSGRAAFRQNDVITVLGKEDESWWLGETGGRRRRGVFPYNYVQPYSLGERACCLGVQTGTALL